ncbi:beta,beta-carotene 15,15'-dioxygenase-like [Mytilus trossulus]|uniref:beta,beta-carotene 15,15'-dioxygenase-like n=1 Tax=Mytilus trossulus TaxID=6551 RepID=UPI003006587D
MVHTAILLVSLVCKTVQTFHVMSEPDPGFDTFFTTNLEEMLDVPIHFDKPLPSWLRGTLIRNGLGMFEVGHRNFTHSFDAFGKLASWKFYGNGSASFSTNFIKSDFYKDSIAKDDIAPYLMFESVKPSFNEFQKMEALVRGIDNMNVNVYRFFNRQGNNYEYAVLNDFWKIYQINPTSLDTISPVTADLPHKGHSGSYTFLSFLSTAHPLPEYGTSNHFTFVSSVSLIPGIKSRISLIRIKSMEEREEIASWPVDRVPYMHSFSVTKNYVIIFAAPFFVNVMNMVRYAAPIKGLDWKANEPTTVYVINLKTKAVTSLETDNVFTMHHVNAFESGSEIIVDISSYPSPNFVKNLEVSILKDPIKRNLFDAHAYLRRYIINLSKESIMFEPIQGSKAVPFSHNLDLPTINENYRYKDYCFVYGLVLKIDNVTLSREAIVKKDLCRDNNDKYWYVENHYASEAVFIPSPTKKTEDDGYLIVPILDGYQKKSYIAIIDAVSMEIINKADLPTYVPFNLHGRYFDGVL